MNVAQYMEASGSIRSYFIDGLEVGYTVDGRRQVFETCTNRTDAIQKLAGHFLNLLVHEWSPEHTKFFDPALSRAINELRVKRDGEAAKKLEEEQAERARRAEQYRLDAEAKVKLDEIVGKPKGKRASFTFKWGTASGTLYGHMLVHKAGSGYYLTHIPSELRVETFASAADAAKMAGLLQIVPGWDQKKIDMRRPGIRSIVPVVLLLRRNEYADALAHVEKALSEVK